MAKLTLTREQRARFFAGGCPAITGTGACPVEKGYTHSLSKHLAFEVTRIEAGHGIDEGKPCRTWQLHYTVIDRRDPVRLLRRTPPVHHFGESEFDDDGFPLDKVELDAEGFPTASTSEPSGYTTSRISNVPKADEAPSRHWEDEHAKQCRVRDLSAVDDPKREANRLRDSAGRARARGIDISLELDAIRQANDEIRRKLAEQAA